MRLLLLFVILNLAFVTSKASFGKDTTFISYKEFAHLNKKEVKQMFYKDEKARQLTDRYYHDRNRGFGLLLWIIPLAGAGTYFTVRGSNTTNGMAGTINTVLAVMFFLPAFVLLMGLISRIFSKRNQYSKKDFYNDLKEHYTID